MMNSQSNQQCQQLPIEHLKEGRDRVSGLCMHSKPGSQEGKRLYKVTTYRFGWNTCNKHSKMQKQYLKCQEVKVKNNHMLLLIKCVGTHIRIIQYFSHFSTMGSFSSKGVQYLIQHVRVTC